LDRTGREYPMRMERINCSELEEKGNVQEQRGGLHGGKKTIQKGRRRQKKGGKSF